MTSSLACFFSGLACLAASRGSGERGAGFKRVMGTSYNELQSAGYQPVLAHPERYNFYHNSINEYKKLKDIGCLFQLNILSTVGYYGQKISKISDFLIDNGYIDFVGSDVHHTKHLENLKKRVLIKNHDNLSQIFKNNSFFNF